jgi:NADH dehydrogenase (ubiquinone) 1 alpha subcomplex subunit 6
MWLSARRLARATTARDVVHHHHRLSRGVTASATAMTRANGPSDILSTMRPSRDRPSTSIDEALTRGRELYRDACREIPWVLSNYAMEEVTTRNDLRRALKGMIRAKGEDIMRTVPRDDWSGALDQAVMRGREELVALEAHHYQRHHLIARFVDAERAETKSEVEKSAFVKNFLSNGRREM